MTFSWSAFWLGWTCASALMFAAYLFSEAVRKYIGHHDPRGPMGVG